MVNKAYHKLVWYTDTVVFVGVPVRWWRRRKSREIAVQSRDNFNHDDLPPRCRHNHECMGARAHRSLRRRRRPMRSLPSSNWMTVINSAAATAPTPSTCRGWLDPAPPPITFPSLLAPPLSLAINYIDMRTRTRSYCQHIQTMYDHDLDLMPARV